MPSPRVPLASWCPVCQSREIGAAPVEQAVQLGPDVAAMTARPWSCRACGALFLMCNPLKVTKAPPVVDFYAVGVVPPVRPPRRAIRGRR